MTTGCSWLVLAVIMGDYKHKESPTHTKVGKEIVKFFKYLVVLPYASWFSRGTATKTVSSLALCAEACQSSFLEVQVLHNSQSTSLTASPL